MAASYNRCDQATFYKLCKLLEASREELLRTRPHPEDLAARYSKNLGQPISKLTINKAKKTTGIEYFPARRPGVSRNQLRDGLATVARSMLAVMQQLGVLPDNDLVRICEG